MPLPNPLTACTALCESVQQIPRANKETIMQYSAALTRLQGWISNTLNTTSRQSFIPTLPANDDSSFIHHRKCWHVVLPSYHPATASICLSPLPQRRTELPAASRHMILSYGCLIPLSINRSSKTLLTLLTDDLLCKYSYNAGRCFWI